MTKLCVMLLLGCFIAGCTRVPDEIKLPPGSEAWTPAQWLEHHENEKKLAAQAERDRILKEQMEADAKREARLKSCLLWGGIGLVILGGLLGVGIAWWMGLPKLGATIGGALVGIGCVMAFLSKYLWLVYLTGGILGGIVLTGLLVAAVIHGARRCAAGVEVSGASLRGKLTDDIKKKVDAAQGALAKIGVNMAQGR
jgi:hypothetical protein